MHAAQEEAERARTSAIGSTAMQTPLQITFEGMPPSDFARARVEREAERLERFFGRMTSCRVVVEAPDRHKNKGGLFGVRIHITLPGEREIAVARHPAQHHAHEDVYVAIRDAFAAARRQLQDEARRMRGKVKHFEGLPEGEIAELFPEEGYGFIRTADGREIYFHRNSVLAKPFEDLKVGTKVAFFEERGDEGPQASTVHVRSHSSSGDMVREGEA